MSNQVLGYTPIQIATNGVSLIPNFKTSDLIDENKIRTHRLQRDHMARLRKMQKHFRKQLPTLYNFHIAHITKPISGTVNGEEIAVQPGFDMLDGHTRRADIVFSLKKGENNYPNEVPVLVYEVDTFNEYKDLYYSFDSSDSVETTNQKIVGACRAIGITLDSTTGRSGGFGTALNIAYPGDPKDDVLVKVAYFRNEIVDLDAIGLFKPESKEFKSQCLFAMGLMALKYYHQPDSSRTRIIAGLTRLAKAKKNTLDLAGDKWYGLDCIEYEFLSEPGKWIPKEYHRKTSFTAVEPQMNFFWYCIENYMTKNAVSKVGGVKTQMFKDKYKKYKDALLATQSIEGYDFIEDDEEDVETDQD